MPYTPAHAIAALPFRNSSLLCFSALVIGTLTPDAEHLLNLYPENRISHQWNGLFWFSVPLGLLLFFVYRKIWIHALDDLFPHWNLKQEDCRPPRVVLSVWLGAFTHLLWDSFTHVDQFGTRLIPILETEVPVGSFGLFPYSWFLQHASTVLGLVILGSVLWKAANVAAKRFVVTFDIMATGFISLLVCFVLFKPDLELFIISAAKLFLALTLLQLTLWGYIVKFRSPAGS